MSFCLCPSSSYVYTYLAFNLDSLAFSFESFGTVCGTATKRLRWCAIWQHCFHYCFLHRAIRGGPEANLTIITTQN